MSTIQKVVVAGPGSPVAQSLIPLLLSAGFEVTALTRASSQQPDLPSGVKAIQVNYDDTENLTSALSGQDALVSTLGSAAIQAQANLIDAVLAAGVKRYVPSEYGCDTENAKTRTLPAYAPKISIAEDIEKKVKGTQTTYTYVYNNAFLDWGIEHSFLIDVKGKKMEINDGGDNKFTVTPVPMVAKAIVGVLKNADKTANRAVRVHGASLTQNQLLAVAKKAVGDEGWTVTERTGEEVEQKAWQNLKTDPGNVFGWVLGFLLRAVHGEGFGGDFSANNDNALLGVKELTEAEIEEIVKVEAVKLK